jgi:hypothetical protein
MRTIPATLAVLVPAAASAHEIAEPHQHGGDLFWLVVLTGAAVATALLLWLRKTRARD